MRTINKQLEDLMSGIKTVEEILGEGVGSYAIENYEPQTSEEAEHFYALRTAWLKRQGPATENEDNNDVDNEDLVSCSCGHLVSKSLVMTASMGTSCPDCYDMMSD